MTGVETPNEARSKLWRKAGQFNARSARRTLPALVLMTDDMRDVDWLTAVLALPPETAVIVRHRDAHKRETLARQLRPVCAARRIKLLIADDPALAMRVRADGVHIPERFVARLAALKALHPSWLVTTSAHSARAVDAASRANADGVLIAPVFATASHPGREALGALRLRALCTRSRVAAYALGGIDAKSIQRLAALPLSGVALIGGWTKPS